MSKPLTAVQQALKKLNHKEAYNLDEVANEAKSLIGEDIAIYQDAFLHTALKKKAKQVLRTWKEDEPTQPELPFIGEIQHKRFPVKLDDGSYEYRTFLAMRWSDFIMVRDERANGISNDTIMLKRLEDVMRMLAPSMALNPSFTAREALILMKDNTAA